MENKRINYSSGAPWESIVGYSRAVKSGNFIAVAGTTAVENGAVAGVNDLYLQTRVILAKIKSVLEEAGSGMEHVVRTRMFVTDISRWEEAGRAHGEYFAAIKPASTLVEVKSLVHPDMLIEIEADAIVPF